MVKSQYSIRDDPNPIYLSQELKYRDTTWNLSTTNIGVVFPFTMPTQGVGSTQRLGDRATSVRLEVSLTSQLNTSVNSDVIRFVIFQSKGLLTSAPAVTDLLEAVTPISPYLYNARDLYEIVHDDQRSYIAQGDSGIMTERYSLSLPIKDLKFQSTTTTLYSGQLWVLLLGIVPAGVNHVAHCRLWFEDSN